METSNGIKWQGTDGLQKDLDRELAVVKEQLNSTTVQEIVDNLNSNKTKSALSARQGKVLGNMVSQESNIRNTSDLHLQSNIDKEVSNRISAIATAVNNHNENIETHEDIRQLVTTETTLRQGQEVSSITYDEVLHTITLSMANGTVKTVVLPVASTSVDGIMPSESINQIETNRLEIESIKGIQKIIPTDKALPPNLTWAEVVAIFNDEVNDIIPVTGDTLMSFNSVTSKFSYTYFSNDNTWRFAGDSAVAGATNLSSGVVKGDAVTNGKVYVEDDLSMSVNGWDATQNSIIVNANDISAHKLNLNNPHNVSAAQLGLGNVNNTSDANKPISSATQAGLDGKANDSAVVHLYGEETISGNKVFSGTVTITGTLII